MKIGDEPMPAAEDVAKSLAVKFLENGNYEALGLPLGHDAASLYARPALVADLDQYFEDEDGFSGLAVHSVGYTAGSDIEKVLIYVTRGSKKALKEVAVEIEGIQVEAKLMGKMRAGPVPSMAAYNMGNIFERNGRIACGSSCAPSGQNYAGTLGALVRDGARLFALSNNHIFAACNHTPVGMPILAPATMDTRPGRPAPSEICRHERLVELRSGDPALVPLMRLDAAIGQVVNANSISSWQGDVANGYDTPGQTAAPAAGTRVKKFGRTTGLTFGTIEAYVPTPWILPYKSGKFSAMVWFTDTWTIRTNDSDPFALPGDSGSLVVTDDASAALGLLFAVSSRGHYGIIAPMDQVLAAFGSFQMVSGHGI